MSVLDAFVHDPLVEWEDEKRKLVCYLIFPCHGYRIPAPLGSGHVTKGSWYNLKFLRNEDGHPGACEIRAKSNREKAQGDIFPEEFSQSC